MDRISLRLDLHVHTRASVDSVNTIGDINGRCRELSIDGYAICDHDSTDSLAEASASSIGLVVVPGLEVTARGAHILCLDPSDSIPPHRSIAETVERIHAQGATAVLAHPFGIPRSYVRYANVAGVGFDAVETANSEQAPFETVMGWNRVLAGRLGLPETGGSDSHIPETFGRSFTVVESASRDPEDVIQAIRDGRTRAFGSGTSLGERLAKIWRVYHKA